MQPWTVSRSCSLRQGDVYKRQFLILRSDIVVSILPIVFGLFVIFDSISRVQNALDPVSYTHLDVYKRQPRYNALMSTRFHLSFFTIEITFLSFAGTVFHALIRQGNTWGQ